MNTIKKLLTLALLFLCLIPLNGKASDIEQKSNVLKELMTSFSKVCVDSNGNILDNVVVVDREGIVENGKAINCGDEARRLAAMINELKLEMKNPSSAPLMCGINDPLHSIVAPDNAILDLAEKFKDKEQGVQCETQTAGQCVQDIACNVFRSVGFSSILNLVNKKTKSKELLECASVSKGSCLTEAITGVFKDLWGNVEGVWALAKMGAHGVKDLSLSAWKKLTGVEDKTSDAAMLASVQSPSALTRFRESPLGFMKGMIAGLFNAAGESIKKNFACEKWEGVPHFSNCLKEMHSWDCASCDQKINAMCGVVGVLGGEVLAAYITGGAAAVVKTAAKNGAIGLSKVNQAITKAIPVLAKGEEAVALSGKVTGNVAKQVALKTVALAEQVVNSEIAKRILAFTKKSTQPALSFVKGVAAKNAVKVTFKLIEGATSPITEYINLLDKSFKTGLAHGQSAAGSAGESLNKFSDYLSGEKTVQSTEDVTVMLNGKLTREEMLLKLNESKIPYEEILLPDGNKGIRIKLDPSCKNSGLIIR